MSKKRGLGTSLAALLSSQLPLDNAADAPNQDRLVYLSVSLLQPSKYQPRKILHDEALTELAASIGVQGILQPIIVRPITNSARYEIIAGERRWRAAQMAGLITVPTIIKELDDNTVLAIALIENIQREALSPLEEAEAFSCLMHEFTMTHQQIAAAVGKSRTSITNSLRLLNLAEKVKIMLGNGDIEMGHARALLTLTPEDQCNVADLIASKQLSVRQAEELVQDRHAPAKSTGADQNSVEHNIPFTDLQHALSQRFGLPVRLKSNSRGNGQLIIKYQDIAEITALLELFPQHEQS